tara:strand:+ start:234 stop:527 length:294 start_codon:yes stop_codon:yes gene_type:complete
MPKRTTVINHKSGFTSSFVTEDERGIFYTEQDVSNIIKYTKHLGEQTPSKEFRHVAEIPMVIYEKACLEGWANDKDAWKKWLNNPENKPFRSWQGKI